MFFYIDLFFFIAFNFELLLLIFQKALTFYIDLSHLFFGNIVYSCDYLCKKVKNYLIYPQKKQYLPRLG